MPPVRIAGPDDPRVAEYRHVADHDRLGQRGLFVAEGRLVVERLLRDGRFAVRSVLVNDPAWRALDPLLRQLDPDVPVFVCETGDLEGLTGYNVHRGCLALASRPSPLPLENVLHGARSLLVLEQVGNADNVGGIFRNAAAFGVDAVVLSDGCADPLYRKAIRTSMAATLRVPFSVIPDADGWLAALARVHAEGFQIVALTTSESAQDLESFARETRHERIAVLLGAEGDGLSPAAQAVAHARVRIAMRGDVDSLNVAVAAGITLHRLLPSSVAPSPAPST